MRATPLFGLSDSMSISNCEYRAVGNTLEVPNIDPPDVRAERVIPAGRSVKLLKRNILNPFCRDAKVRLDGREVREVLVNIELPSVSAPRTMPDGREVRAVL